jgi:HEAT repeat protein
MFVKRCLVLAAGAAILGATLAGSATAQSNSKEIMAKPTAELVELVKSPDASAFEKAKACQRLAVVGTSDAIPALAALLADEKLNLYARFALEAIPDPAADDALRTAATKLEGRQLVGVINSIGKRKDAQALDLLKGLMGHADKAVAMAAAHAIGNVGTVEAAAILTEALAKDSPMKRCLGDGALACAEGLAAAGKQAEAIALYQTVAKSSVPKYMQIGALDGQFRLQKTAAKDLLMAQIRSEGKADFQLGLSVARWMPGADVTATLAGELEKLPAERQALLLRALGDRKEAAPLPTVVAATKSESPAVREAAIAVLAKLGDASAVTILLDAALGEGAVAVTAKEGLKNLAVPEADAAILAKLAEADAKSMAVLFELAGARRIAAAAGKVREALASSDESVKLAALAALGQLIAVQDLELLTSRALAGGNAPETVAAQAALRMAALRMADREATAAKLAATLSGASAENQAYLLELLGKVSGKKALQTVAAAAKSSDAALKEAATKALGEWPNPEAADALLDLAKTDPENKYRVRALRGYIRIARQLQLPDDVKLTMFQTVMETADRDADKQVALDILTRIPSVPTLKLAASYVDQTGLQDAAADAAVKIGKRLVDQHPKDVAAAMQKVVDAKVGGNPGSSAKQLLDQAQAASR